MWKNISATQVDCKTKKDTKTTLVGLVIFTQLDFVSRAQTRERGPPSALAEIPLVIVLIFHTMKCLAHFIPHTTNVTSWKHNHYKKLLFMALYFKTQWMVAILELQSKSMLVQVDRILKDKAMLIM
jgi:hypothetical protein